jgi:ribonuclease HI
LGRPRVDLSLTKLQKGNTSADTFKKAFQALTKKYPKHTHIYTDGSKDSSGVGAAACSDLMSSQKKLNFLSSVFSAESAAIQLALDQIETSSSKHFLILSDSLSCLSSLKGFNISDSRILSIVEKLQLLSKQKEIVFAWVPGHTGIPGNDRADGLAKAAIETDGINNDAVHHMDLRCVLHRSTSNMFNNYWGAQTSNKLYKIMPDLKPVAKPCLSRKCDAMLHRLRIGHTALTHSYLLRGEPPPLCESCDQPLSVEHVLLKCKKWHQVRGRFFKTTCLKNLFNHNIVDPNRIFGFLKEIELLKYL